MQRIVIALMSFALPLAACNQAPAEPAPSDPAPPEPSAEAVAVPSEPAAAEVAPAAAQDKPAADASDKVDDPTFELALAPTGEYEAGKLSSFALSLVPRGKYHVNQEYPMSIELSGPDGIAFAKPRLEVSDAAEFTETKARFDVPFTPAAAGEHKLQALVKFAVCTPETCVPDERTLALAVAVK